MFVTRGVPGTHDIDLGLAVFEALENAGDLSKTAIPVFAKRLDDRLPREDWKEHRGRPDLVLFDGWCVGTPPQTNSELLDPINELERVQDPQGVWRSYSNEQLSGPYQSMFASFDLLIMLKVPGLHKVIEWRTQQEQELIERTGPTERTMTPTQIREFIGYYERLTEHALRTVPDLADLVLEIDNEHQIAQVCLTDKTGQCE